MSNTNDISGPLNSFRTRLRQVLRSARLVSVGQEKKPSFSGNNEPPQEGYIINIRRVGEGDPLEFEVVVRQQGSETTHRVRIAREMYQRLSAGKHTPEGFLDATFRFLLDREPKEAILRRFDVGIIERYSPEFERELPHYLSGD